MNILIKNILLDMKNILNRRILEHKITDNYVSYILFVHLYNLYFNIKDYRLIDLIIEEFERSEHQFLTNNSFWYGKAGIGYALSIIDKEIYHEKIEKYKKDVELYLRMLCKEPDIFTYGHRTYDLFFGMAGCCLFLLEVDSKNNICVEKCLDTIIYNINVSDDKLSKFKINKKYTRNIFIKKISYDYYVDLGKAHGLAGILKILKICKNKHYKNDGMDKAISKIENFYHNGKNNLNYNLWNRIYPSKEYYEENNSWCYGNLGIITSLYNNKDKKTYFYINKVKKNCLNRIKNGSITNYFFCHGIIGEIFMINQYDCDFCKNEEIKKYYDNIIKEIDRLDLEKVPEKFALDNIFSILDGVFSIIAVYLFLYCEFDKYFFERMFLIEVG